MSTPMRFVMIGGFLGAGKTTTIARLAAAYRARGQNVGIVTNDQAAGLVDTHLLRSQGYDVGEVAGACFCCSFDQLTTAVTELGAAQRPHVILAEPVGSCTDLVATVAQPIKHLYAEDFVVGPYAVILKPSHGQKILRRGSGRGFSPKAEYIFRKQLEEADLLLLNRIDELTPTEADELEALLRDEYGTRPILRMSAKTGEGLDALLAALEAPGDHCRRILDLDYDVYAEGEAELGWLNASCTFTAHEAFELDELLVRLTDAIRELLQHSTAEVAHLKSIGLTDGAYAVVNLVSSDTPVTLSLASHAEVKRAEVVINARVATDPEGLKGVVEQALRHVAGEKSLQATVESMQSFRPGRPVPTHRYSANA